jgi:hypothetical protein
MIDCSKTGEAKSITYFEREASRSDDNSIKPSTNEKELILMCDMQQIALTDILSLPEDNFIGRNQ